MKPSLSYVKQPIKEIGERATAKLIDHIKDNKANIEHIKIPTEIIIRDTCIKRQIMGKINLNDDRFFEPDLDTRSVARELYNEVKFPLLNLNSCLLVLINGFL